MTTALLASLPLQLVCHLIVPGAPGVGDTNFAVNQSPSQIQSAILPNGYVPLGSKAVLLASLPLELVCQLLVTSNPSVTENGTLVQAETTTRSPRVTVPEDDVITSTISPVRFFDGNETTTSTQATPTKLPEGYVAFPEDHVAYKIHREGATWNNARELCIAEGARLAIADTIEKVRHINSLKSDGDSKWLHVGIRKLTSAGDWVRDDNGLPPSSIPWIENNPDGTGDCAGISIGWVGLVDYSCDWGSEWYVCEIPISED